MYTFLNLLTRENITLALAILGSIGSLSSWIYTFINNRKNLTFHIVGRRYFENESLFLYMSFVNKSRLPISITSIGVKIDDELYSCQEVPIATFEETAPDKHREYKSMPMPISIPGLGGTSGYVYFGLPKAVPQADATHLIFRVSTNRGRIIERKLALGTRLD